ncbi:PH domain-containing protein [Nesterenkonia lutea]|uniref:Membrane protein n=1 Tax=Nesterenkonia lutea TaxID=272919 RepID=A0ABR9JGI9_9MICC|nr:PH domain-containing protein [Nesterenkonia lutea]MBE1525053.1 putative membrane protein [Nesterenkonia lutea]
MSDEPTDPADPRHEHSGHEHPGQQRTAAQPPAQGSAQDSAGRQDSEPERWFDASWTKVHPLSPFVRGWVTVVAIPGIIFGYNWQMWADAWQAFQSGDIQRDVSANPTPFILGGLGALLIILLIFGSFVLSWWFTRYKITTEHVMVKSGVFVRQHRQARIDRVQAVDLRQPLLARLTGLAELKFEVAEGDGTAATLAFLKKAQAEELRAEIMDRASGVAADAARPSGHTAESDLSTGSTGSGGAQEVGAADVGDPRTDPRTDPLTDSGTDSGTDPLRPAAAHSPSMGSAASQDRLIAKVPTGRLIGSVLSGWGTVFLCVLIIIGVVAIVAGAVTASFTPDEGLGEIWPALVAASLPAAIPMGIAALTIYYQQFSSGFGFTSIATSAGLRIRYGLLETTNQTIPPGRVQALQIQQPVLWRPFKWFRIVVTVAGYGIGEKRSVLLPVGRLEDVMATAAEMFPDLQVENPEEVFTAGLLESGTELDFTEVPRRARLFDPFVRRRRGFRTTPAALMFRDGRAARRLTMIPHERIQSLSMHQGPLQRGRRVADVFIHSPAGPFQARLKNQDLDAVQELFAYESDQAAQARRYSDRNHWMRPEELQEFERKAAEAIAPDQPDQRGPVPTAEPASTRPLEQEPHPRER